jgi:uncharacterized protein
MYWFDLDNSPHVPLFRPIFKELDEKNQDYLVTIREFAQTRQLCELWNIKYNLIDKHAGKNKFLKVINLISRSSKLKKFVKDKKISLAISHGSRTQLVASHRLKIRSVLMLDYEYTENKIFNYLSDYILIPVYIPEARLKSAGINIKKVIRYNGFKEEIYLPQFKPDENFRKNINISNEKVLVVIRPPGLLSNYHNIDGERLYMEAIKYFSEFSNCCCYIVSRTTQDIGLLKNLKINNNNIRFDKSAVDGLQLLNAADIVLSGGGTMNRESALLGTETYSIFKGRKPYLDEYLQSLGLLKFINSETDFKKINIERKRKNKNYKANSNLIKEISDLFHNLNKN